MIAQLRTRNENLCELCNKNEIETAYLVAPKKTEIPENAVGLCTTCLEKLDKENEGFYWRVVEGSIWNPSPAVQALSYRILDQYKAEDWASNTLSMVDIDEETINWALSATDSAPQHKDAFGNVLENGDTVVLTQLLDVKGTNFSAPKGTVVKRIRLVADNAEQIEGKINEQTIVILTKYVKKNA